MEQNNWDCCRLCLGVENLYPIYYEPEHHDKYTNVLFTVTGVKVEQNDNLPQQFWALDASGRICTSDQIDFLKYSYYIFISLSNKLTLISLSCSAEKIPGCIKSVLRIICNNNEAISFICTCTFMDLIGPELCSTCIHFINNCIRFRKQCEENNMHLLSRLNGKQFYSIKIEATPLLKTEANNPVKIDISHFLIDVEDDFGDYEDNITLNSLKYNSISKPDDALDCTQTNETIKEPLDDEKDTTDNTKVKRKTRVQRIKGNSEKKTKKNCEADKKEVRCEYCNKILTSKLSLRNHYKIHTGFDVVCEHCGKKFITRRLLLMHCRAKHGYEKTDKCSYCDYRASNAEQVKIHERLHTGERPYACSQCDAAFHRKSSYLQHIAIHLPEKTVQCDQCPARFKSVTLMRIHRSRHRAAAYRFQCRVCEGSFARRRNVVRHLLRVHNLPPEQQHIDRRKIG